MAHPYKSEVLRTTKGKMSSMHKDGAMGRDHLPNLYMNGAYKHVDTSSDSMQHAEQSAAPGRKRGGRLDKSSRHSHKSKIARDMNSAPPPSPDDMIAPQAGAGLSSPMPAPAPMQKRGGKVIKKADGGRLTSMKYPLKKGGADTGVGRLEKARAQK